MDEHRFEAVYREHGPSVVRYCAFSAGTYADGEDIAAEVFSRFFWKGASVPEDRAAAWLFKVARNLCVSHHRRQSRIQRLAERVAEEPVPPVASDWGDSELWGRLCSLSETARLVVYLHVVEQRPFNEIARLTRRSESAVKMTFYRSMERVRRGLESDMPRAELAGGSHHA